MKREFEVGDLVRLKSGGPKMTVHKAQSEEVPLHVMCSWFGNGWNENGEGDIDLHKESFPVQALVKV